VCRLPDGNVEIGMVCEPRFDYGRAAAQRSLINAGRAAGTALGARQLIRLETDLVLGIEENRVRGRHVLHH
jgi:hypothetical protein